MPSAGGVPIMPTPMSSTAMPTSMSSGMATAAMTIVMTSTVMPTAAAAGNQCQGDQTYQRSHAANARSNDHDD